MSRKKTLFLITASLILLGALTAYLVYPQNSAHNIAHSKLSGKYDLRDGLIYNGLTNELYNGMFKDSVGDRILEYDIIRGKKSGRFNIYGKDGSPRILGQVKDNHNIGKWTYFDSNGILECTGYFKEDKISDKWTWYYPNGKIKQEGFYINGAREGSWIKYDPAGIIISRITFKKDIIIDELKAERFVSI